MPVDVTRADLDFARNICDGVIHGCGADEMVVVDTLGMVNPQSITYLTKLFREALGAPVHVHRHNECGLAVADSLAWIREGARWVHVALGGLGEKAANTDLIGLSFALRLLHGMDVQLHFDQLIKAAQLVEALSGFHAIRNKLVVRTDLFRRESGDVVQRVDQKGVLFVFG